MDPREVEIRELCAIAGVDAAYATFCIESGMTAEKVRRDLVEALAKDPQHRLAGVMKEQVKRGI